MAMLFALATVACGDDAGGTTDLHGGLTQDQADEAVTALCDIAEGRVTAFDEVRAAFQNRAHETLHHIAAVVEEEDTASAAALLEAKFAVEADLEQDEAPPELAAHAAALAEATSAAIRVIGLTAEACSA
jgi:hypothetical protein